MKIKCVWEHNGDDSLLYSIDQLGAFTRGPSREIALKKMPEEIISYMKWKYNIPPEAIDIKIIEPGMSTPEEMIPEEISVEIVQEKQSELQISDADSDVLFEEEKEPLSQEEYLRLKSLVLKSAEDFWELYQAVPDKKVSCLPFRKTFYGDIPRTAEEMYEHTKNVNAYYFGEIGVEADNEGTIYECRKRGFELLEQNEDFLQKPVTEGSYGENWSLRKVLRRFLWHDRIHAKAMYRMACKTFTGTPVKNIFHF